MSEQKKENEVQFKCRACVTHWSVFCNDREAVIKHTLDKGCPNCKEQAIRLFKVNDKFILMASDFNALAAAGLAHEVEYA